MKPMIVKIQQPIESSLVRPTALVYSQNYSFVGFMAFSEDLKKRMGERPKIYAEAEVDGEGEIKFVREVSEQGW